MKHVILYGPPASGKLSIAEALRKLTGYGLLHNHLTNNLVREVFPLGHPEFSRLVIDFRSDLYEAAARTRVDGLISTFVYGRATEDDKILRNWVRLVQGYGGETCFVRVHCQDKTLFKRVASAKRKGGKRQVSTVKQLKYLLKQADIQGTIPGVASLEVDTDHLKAVQAARLIKKHYRL
jgi:chloramphenicol 3-O-phosphotransferase